MAKGLAVAIAAILIVAVIAKLSTSDRSEHSATSGPSAPIGKPVAASAPIEQNPLPPDEREFIATVSGFTTRYRQAPNEFQKSALRRERAEALARVLPSLSVTDWVGQVSEMATTHGDNWGILSVRIGDDIPITVETFKSNVLSNRTLIPPGSRLYNEVARLTIGHKLTFSGTFEAGASDYVEERSLTEEGSMIDPSFVFTFTTVGPGTQSRRPNAADSEPNATEPRPQRIEKTPETPTPPAPPPGPTRAAGPTSGALHATVELEHGQAVFENLPGGRLKFTFDHDAWQPAIHRQPNGTQTLVMRSLKPGTNMQCDVRWEIVQ